MWIEVDLVVSEGMRTSCWQAVINVAHITYIAPRFDTEDLLIEIFSSGKQFKLITYTPSITNAVYKALLMAIQGQVVNLDSYGYIRPLMLDQIDSVYKRMLKAEVEASLADTVAVNPRAYKLRNADSSPNPDLPSFAMCCSAHAGGTDECK